MTQKFMETMLNSLKEIVIKSSVTRLKPREEMECTKRISALFDYNLAGGKYQRSRLALNIFKVLSPKASNDDIFKAAKISGTIEMVQSFFLILDDIMDQSQTRRGRPCWYTLPEVGLQAINDAFILDCGIHKVIRDTIPAHPQKETIIETLSETKLKTVIGQYLDGASNTVETCTWERYAQIVEHKTSHYTFYCPIAIGFQLADILNYSNQYQKIAYDIGYLFQAQDDYLDVFGDEKVTGKSMSDISNGKCTWLSCRTVEKLSSLTDAFNVFKENFGQLDPQKVAIVRKLMKENDIESDFLSFQESSVRKLHDDIDSFEKVEVRQTLHSLVEALSGRQK